MVKNPMKPLLQDNNVEVYLTDNEDKSVVSEQFFSTCKNEICNNDIKGSLLC